MIWYDMIQDETYTDAQSMERDRMDLDIQDIRFSSDQIPQTGLGMEQFARWTNALSSMAVRVILPLVLFSLNGEHVPVLVLCCPIS